MSQKKPDQASHRPKGKLGKILLNLLITLIVGGVYFYVSLPALNPQSGDFYFFVFLLCAVYILCALVTSGVHLGSPVQTASGMHKLDLKEYFRFIKNQCLPIGLLLLLLLAVGLVGSLISMPLFRAADYRDLLDVQDGDFASDVDEISFNEIPMLDRDSAAILGDRQMGNLPDMVSQFEVSDVYTQINYQGSPVRVAPLEYADLIKWFTNRRGGLPAYVVVNMVTQEASVVRLPDGQGIKYSPSEPLNRNVIRCLRFRFPTFLFSTPVFEIDEEGNPWWIAPRVVKTIGLFGGADIRGAVLMDAVTGACTYYEQEQIPTWVDNVYVPELIMQQYNYHGAFVNGFLNSIFGQRGVTVVTAGSNYIALNDDVYMYTGVTSVNSDQSNLGFLLSNQRTKQTKFYSAPGATENSAMASARGMVQDQGYQATFPLLLNISGEPTYFMALKDANNLVKMYAMVNVAQYQVAAAQPTVAATEQEYIRLLGEKGITTPQDLPQTEAHGVVAEIRSAVMDGTSYYFLRLEGESVYYSVSAAQNPVVVLLNVGDAVTIEHAPGGDEPASILDGYQVTLERAGS